VTARDLIAALSLLDAPVTLLAAARAVLALEDESTDRNALDLRNPLALREAEADYARRRSVAWRAMWRAYEAMGTGDDRPAVLDIVATLVAARVAFDSASEADYEGCGEELQAALDALREACQ